MGLSKGQKKRLYGNNIEAKTTIAPPAETAHKARTQSVRHDSVEANPESGKSFMFVGVAFVIAVLLMLYYYLWVLPEMSERAGTTISELKFWFDQQHALAVNQGLGRDMLVQYQYIHRSSGLIFPLIFAGAWVAMISASQFVKTVSRLMMAVPVLWALVFIMGNFVLDAALANPATGPVGVAALLVAVRWVLFIACWAQLGWMAVRLVQGKIDAFSRGELKGQQPIR